MATSTAAGGAGVDDLEEDPCVVPAPVSLAERDTGVRWLHPMDSTCFQEGTVGNCSACLEISSDCRWCEWDEPRGTKGIFRSFCYDATWPGYAEPGRSVCQGEGQFSHPLPIDMSANPIGEPWRDFRPPVECADSNSGFCECQPPVIVPFFTPQVMIGVVLAALVGVTLLVTIPMEIALKGAELAEKRRRAREERAAEQEEKNRKR